LIIGILYTALKVVYTFMQDMPGKSKQDSGSVKREMKAADYLFNILKYSARLPAFAA
jgi:hypothetical protein